MSGIILKPWSKQWFLRGELRCLGFAHGNELLHGSVCEPRAFGICPSGRTSQHNPCTHGRFSFELERTFNFFKVPKFSKVFSFSYIRNHFELFLGLEA
jgi:hypothetical protein